MQFAGECCTAFAHLELDQTSRALLMCALDQAKQLVALETVHAAALIRSVGRVNASSLHLYFLYFKNEQF